MPQFALLRGLWLHSEEIWGLLVTDFENEFDAALQGQRDLPKRSRKKEKVIASPWMGCHTHCECGKCRNSYFVIFLPQARKHGKVNLFIPEHWWFGSTWFSSTLSLSHNPWVAPSALCTWPCPLVCSKGSPGASSPGNFSFPYFSPPQGKLSFIYFSKTHFYLGLFKLTEKFREKGGTA